MVKFQVAVGCPGPGTKIQPESKPPSRGWQGLAKLDCVTVWFPGLDKDELSLFVDI